MCCQVNVTKGTLSQAEIDAYVDHARQKYNRERAEEHDRVKHGMPAAV